MNDDSVTDAGRRIARTNERVLGTRRDRRRTAKHVASLAARWLAVLVVGVALAWAVAFVVPPFAGILAATVVGFGLLCLVPLAVVTGVVRLLETIE